ncbi:MAG: GNAT family N-acetyltransferase [Pseudomonadota bacterium]
MTSFHETPSSGPTAALAAQIQALVPVLETERLILRAPKMEDFNAIADMLLGPRGKYYGDCKTRDEVWGEFIQLTATWYLSGFGAWTAVDKATGETRGFFHIGAEPGDQEPELGYVVAQDVEGQGFAYEACAAVRDVALRDFALGSLVSYVDAANTRSVALARRLGGTRDAKAEAAVAEIEAPCLVFRYAGPGAH